MKSSSLLIVLLLLCQTSFADESANMFDSFRQLMSQSGIDSAVDYYRLQRQQQNIQKDNAQKGAVPKDNRQPGSFSADRARLNELGYELLYQQRPDDAAKIFQLSNDFFLHDWVDFESLAQTYYEMGFYEESLRYYQQALTMQEVSDSPLKGRKRLVKQIAKIYRKLGDYYAALNIFEIEVARDPEADWAIQKIGQWLLRYGHPKVGVRWLKRATDMQDSPDYAWSKLGNYFRKWSAYRYVRHLREGRDRFPYLASSWDLLVAALLDDYRPREAERVIAKALSLFPADSLWRTARTLQGRKLIRAYAQDLDGESFSAMGCGPYREQDELALKHYMKVENASSNSEFIVHLGDLGKGLNNVPESRYANMADMLSNKNTKPTFVVLGDNDWNDTVDPALSLGYWKRYLGNFYQRFDMHFYVTTQPQREENFSFELGDVVYIGINLPEGYVHDTAEWTKRINDNAQWIEHNLATDNIKAAVIMAHAPADIFDGMLLKSLRESAIKFAKPLMFLHANGHKWSHRQDEKVSNLLHVQTNKLHDDGPGYPPVQIRFTGREDLPFVFDRRIASPLWRVRGAG